MSPQLLCDYKFPKFDKVTKLEASLFQGSLPICVCRKEDNLFYYFVL